MTDALWIMRHGEAAPGRPDHLRDLTETGRRDVEKMAGWLDIVLEPAVKRELRLAVSPYARAQQTADIIAERLGVTPETLALITPDDPVEDVIEWLQINGEGVPWLLVSHMPLVGELTARLVDGERSLGGGFPAAGVVGLQADVWAAGCADLIGFQSPRELAE
ncbi:phosphohistidine phosphatase SixA [Aidingimonas halophila]|uniref:Phosphohistidine phosphatase, SixA n=1 Tax=Aidingimonas halophila TaxID=574349 RepID=A0A1H3F390_9GAMM|nr:phosphohistidine phosphatase SixA [Aidingimonas halophila]GHC32290.1 phosphohistidine phosphatase SixA [Aidingimonas halophila]SDX85493.1 phosphohistidine phosphatase, SixA [Aidingimonas halophila]